jgi:hypothetical protein
MTVFRLFRTKFAVLLSLCLTGFLPAVSFAEQSFIHGYLDQASQNFQMHRPDGSATFMDVGKCTALAEAVAVMAWYGPQAAEGLGKAAIAANDAAVKIAALVKVSKPLLTTIEMMAAIAGYKIMPKSWLQWTLDQLFSFVVKPLWNGCTQVGGDFASLPSSVATIMSGPDYTQLRSMDTTGIKNGRWCAEENDGWLGAGWKACVTCCDRRLNRENGLAHRAHACRAVCNAQFK